MATKTGKKKVVLQDNITREDAENAFAEFADADARIQQLTGKMDVELTRIREKYADELTNLTGLRDDSFMKLQAFAVNNREAFGKLKSMELTHGKIGFRTGTPKLKTLKGFTWEAALKLVKAFAPAYIRTKEEINKEALLADRGLAKVANKLADMGITVDQDETFFVDPKKELAQVA